MARFSSEFDCLRIRLSHNFIYLFLTQYWILELSSFLSITSAKKLSRLFHARSYKTIWHNRLIWKKVQVRNKFWNGNFSNFTFITYKTYRLLLLTRLERNDFFILMKWNLIDVNKNQLFCFSWNVFQNSVVKYFIPFVLLCNFMFNNWNFAE